MRDVASAVASFLGTLLRSILSDAIRSLRSVRNMYVKEVAEVLCSPDPKMRLVLLQDVMWCFNIEINHTEQMPLITCVLK